MHVPHIHHRRVIWALITTVLLLGTLFVLAHFNFGFLMNTQEATQQTNTTDSYFDSQEAVVVKTQQENGTTTEETVQIKKSGVKYIEVRTSCDHDYAGNCVHTYDGPSFANATTSRLRKDMVLQVGGEVQRNGETWYRITFGDQWLRYPDRIETDWYVPAQEVAVLYEDGVKTTWEDGNVTTSKRIVIDKSEQTLYAYEGDGTLFLETPVSTGLSLSPTTVGTFSVFKKTPSRYMQGPIEGVVGSDYYDLPGVPWNLYFTEDGAVIHGAYWHESFGQRYSHGCVNLPPAAAERLYGWAPLGVTVVVQE